MMKVTIGVRLGLIPKNSPPAVPEHISDDPEYDHAAPEFITPERVLRLTDCASADTIPFERISEPLDDERLGPPRVRGEMVWLHKTAPVLVIEGRPPLSPEEHAAGRRR
jgi:hypothetical protein